MVPRDSDVSVAALKAHAGRVTFALYGPQDAGSDAVDGALTPPAKSTENTQMSNSPNQQNKHVDPGQRCVILPVLI